MQWVGRVDIKTNCSTETREVSMYLLLISESDWICRSTKLVVYKGLGSWHKQVRNTYRIMVRKTAIIVTNGAASGVYFRKIRLGVKQAEGAWCRWLGWSFGCSMGSAKPWIFAGPQHIALLLLCNSFNSIFTFFPIFVRNRGRLYLHRSSPTMKCDIYKIGFICFFRTKVYILKSFIIFLRAEHIFGLTGWRRNSDSGGRVLPHGLV
jgi:hypothetical protein